MPGVGVANMSARYMHTSFAKIPRSSRDHEELVKADAPIGNLNLCEWLASSARKLILESASTAVVIKDIGPFGHVEEISQ